MEGWLITGHDAQVRADRGGVCTSSCHHGQHIGDSTLKILRTDMGHQTDLGVDIGLRL